MKFTAEQLRDHNLSTLTHDGYWVPARPIEYRYQLLGARIKEAWLVLKGKADIVLWEGNDEQ